MNRNEPQVSLTVGSGCLRAPAGLAISSSGDMSSLASPGVSDPSSSPQHYPGRIHHILWSIWGFLARNWVIEQPHTDNLLPLWLWKFLNLDFEEKLLR